MVFCFYGAHNGSEAAMLYIGNFQLLQMNYCYVLIYPSVDSFCVEMEKFVYLEARMYEYVVVSGKASTRRRSR